MDSTHVALVLDVINRVYELKADTTEDSDPLTTHHNTQPSLLFCSAKLPEVIENFCNAHGIELSFSESPNSVDTGKRYHLAIISDFFDATPKNQQIQFICSLRNLNTDRILIANSVQSLNTDSPSLKDYIGMGFNQVESAEDTKTAIAFQYNLSTYNFKRSWNNPKFWANPENWQKYRW